MLPSQNKRSIKVRLARMSAWIDGCDEFPRSFEELDRKDQDKVRWALGEAITLLECQEPIPDAKEAIAALPMSQERPNVKVN